MKNLKNRAVVFEEIKAYEPFYFSLTNPSATSRFSKDEHGSHGGGKPSNEIPSKTIYLAFGDINSKKSFKSNELELFYINNFKKEENFDQSSNSLNFKVPNNGYYNLYAINKTDGFYKVAKLEYLHAKH